MKKNQGKLIIALTALLAIVGCTKEENTEIDLATISPETYKSIVAEEDAENEIFYDQYSKALVKMLKKTGYTELYTYFTDEQENSLVKISDIYKKFKVKEKVKPLKHLCKDYDPALYFFNIKTCNMFQPPIIAICNEIEGTGDCIPAVRFNLDMSCEEIALSEEYAKSTNRPVLVLEPADDKNLCHQKDRYTGKIGPASVKPAKKSKGLKSANVPIKVNDAVSTIKLKAETTGFFKLNLERFQIEYMYEGSGDIEYALTYSTFRGDCVWCPGCDYNTYVGIDFCGNTKIQEIPRSLWQQEWTPKEPMRTNTWDVYCAAPRPMNDYGDNSMWVGCTYEKDWFNSHKPVYVPMSCGSGTLVLECDMKYDYQWYQKFNLSKTGDFPHEDDIEHIDSKGWVEFERVD